MRNRLPAFILAVATTLFVTVGALAADDYFGGDGVFAEAGIMPLASISGYTVDAFCSYQYNQNSTTPGVTNFFTSSSLTSGNCQVYGVGGSIGSRRYGFRVTIPASSVPGTLSIVGLAPALVGGTNSGTISGWTSVSVSSGGLGSGASSYFLGSSSTLLTVTGSDQSYPPFDGSIYIPAHSSTFYLYVFSSVQATNSTNWLMGAVYYSGATLSFTPDSSVSIGSTLSQILTAINNVNTSTQVTTQAVNGTTQAVNNLLQDQQNAPARKAEDSFIGKFGSQIDKVEDALSPSNPALPNGGDVGGFTSDLSDGLGLSGSSFSASDLNNAAAGFSGAEATAVGGPWEFFTQVVADDMSGDSPMSVALDYDPILAWLERAEGRYGVWSNP